MLVLRQKLLLLCALLGTVTCQTSNSNPSYTKAFSGDSTSNQNLGGDQRFGFGPLIPGLPNNVNLIPPGMPPNPLGFGIPGQQGFPSPFLGQPGLLGQQDLGAQTAQQNPYLTGGLQGTGTTGLLGPYAPNFPGISSLNPSAYPASISNTNSINSLQGQVPGLGNPSIFSPTSQGNPGIFGGNSQGNPAIFGLQGSSNPYGSGAQGSGNPFNNPGLGLQGPGNFPNVQNPLGAYPAVQSSNNYPSYLGQNNLNPQAINPYLPTQGLGGNSLFPQGANPNQINPFLGQPGYPATPLGLNPAQLGQGQPGFPATSLGLNPAQLGQGQPGYPATALGLNPVQLGQGQPGYPATPLGLNPSQLGQAQPGLNPYNPQGNSLLSEFDFLQDNNKKRPRTSVTPHDGNRHSGGFALPRSKSFQYLDRDVVEPYAYEVSQLLQIKNPEFKKLFGRSKDEVVKNLGRLGREDKAGSFSRIQKAGIKEQKCNALMKEYRESRKGRSRNPVVKIPNHIIDYCQYVHLNSRAALLEEPEDMVAVANEIKVSVE